VSPIKCDLHVHTAEDPEDVAEMSARELINVAAKLGFDVLSITNHNIVTFDDELKKYAWRRGILLLPGSEISVRGKHVLVINSRLRGNKLDKRIGTFEELEKIKDDETLIIAPHPFHRARVCLGKSLKENLHLFDALEASHFYSQHINLNEKAERYARRYGLPLVGTSDAHFFFQFGRSFSLVESEKDDPGSVVAAVKAGRVESVTRPLTILGMGKVLLWLFLARLLRPVRTRNRQRVPALKIPEDNPQPLRIVDKT